MRKYTRKLLAFFVSFVMAVVMVPMNGFNSYAADTTVSVTTYQKVTSTNNWESDKEYVIYSNGYALVNKNGSISAQQVTLTGENPTVPDSAIWKISKSGSNYNVSNNNKYLNISKDKLSLGSIQGLNIKKDGANRISYGKNYLSFENNYWTASSNKSKVEIYKKVTETKTIKDLTPDEKLYNDDAAVGKEYPDPGFVKIKKQATSTNFNGTGVAEVELSATGVPMRKGSDIVLILDVSSSMKDGFTPGTPMYDTKKAAEDFVNKVLGDNADGTKSNNRLALVTFAGRAPGSNTYTGEEGYGNEILNTFKNANSKDKIITKIQGIQHQQGTDYDYAFKAAGQLLEKADSNRDKYVVFMTDGEPYNYNGIQNFNSIPFINGVPEEHKLSSDIKTKYGDKLKLYSIGFDMQLDKAKAILQNISSGDGYYIDATNTTELNGAFSKIATSIKKAGTDAVVTDVIGDAFTLQTTKTLPNNKPDLTYDPTIKVTAYDTYTHADYNAGNCEYNDIGKRKDNKEVLETVRFSADGKAAYSDQIGNGDTNILEDGVITAKTFKYTLSTKTFEWTIGDITEQDIALSYYVYLKGSMEGQRGDGLYDTNKIATINYNDYLGKNTTKEYEKPKMPWGAAVVNYEFYLVNEKGQPVNSKGEVVPFENRFKISGVKQVKFNWNADQTVEATVAAKDLVPKGYSLHIEDAAYTVHAVSSGNGSYKIKGTVPSGAQDSTQMYEADKQYSNSYVAFGVLNKTTLIPDTVVLDYGKPIDIDVMANDRVQNAVLDSVAPGNTDVGVALGDGSTDNLVTGFKPEVQLTNGKAKVDNGKVVYTPTKYMDSIDKFLYSAKVTTSSTVAGGDDINYYRYQTVNVIPATTVYYEDNFGNTGDQDPTNGIIYTGDWETEGTSSDTKQDGYVEGQDVYGSDSSYSGDNTLSGGSAKVVVGTPNANTTASFKFKGTGFDLISRTNTTSTKIVVNVKDKDGNLVKSKVLDNLYKSGDLYQIPVYKVHDLAYGEYTVVIIVGASSKVGEGANFYLDAIRIYDPLGKDKTDNGDFEEANTQYKADKEAYASITELRKILIKADSFTAGQPVSQTLKGAVFVDKTEDEYTVTNYENNGPNNEVYLKKGQSIAFKLTTTGDPTSIKIGAKAPNGEAKFEFGSSAGTNDPISLSTATDMYYDVTNNIKFTTKDDGSKEGIVIITNNSEKDNIVSLTDLKITYSEPQVVETSQSVDSDTVEQALKVAKLRLEKTEDTSNNDTSSTDKNDDNQSSSNNTNPRPSHNIFQTIKNWFSKWF
ncbi:vWA domain-containing protein [Terrisporobacter sp.]|uniref:vWA domain-containing protein n=1 Tax=Terrisporobacter sp. TaxID=1965305 RepID=UPI003994B6CA